MAQAGSHFTAFFDLATGSGMPPGSSRTGRRQRNISVQIHAADLSSPTLDVARKLSREYPEISHVRADARTFADTPTYDFVCCALALHRFGEEDAARLLRRAAELSP